jgi:ABC-2 type transport system permease protein
VTSTVVRNAPSEVPVEPLPGRDVALGGTGRLLGLVLRRDRLRLVLWVLGIVVLVGVSAGSVEGLYDTPEDLAGYAAIVEDNAAMIIQAGPGYGLESPTVGAVLMNETSLWAIIGVALMSIFMTVRHTRAEEESERAELLRSGPVGRYAGATAAVLGVAMANVAVAVGVVAVLVLYGFEASGSVAFGAALVGAGMVFCGVALVTAQVAASSRAALGLAVVVLGLSFVVRAVGDVAENGLSWLSPIGVAQGIRAFADERWWVLAVPVLSALALFALAGVLAGHRDFGGGLLVERAGRAEARPSLASPLALSWRLQRASILGWAAGVAVLGFFYGFVADQAEKMLEENPEIADYLALVGQASITDVFLATSILMAGLLASGFTIAAVLRMRSEETAGRADPVLATPVSRGAWAAGHLGVVLAGAAIVMVAGGAATGLGAAVSIGGATYVTELVGAALAMLPAVTVLGALAFLLVALVPRWSLLAWAGLVVVSVVGLLGPVLGLPDWSFNLSPFDHVPAVPAEAFTVLPVALLASVTVVLVAVGLVGLRHRDLDTA